MSGNQVQEIPAEVADQIGSDLFDSIAGDMLPPVPGAPAPTAAPKADAPKADAPKPETQAKPAPLAPTDFADTPVAVDEPDVIKDDEVEQVFRGDEKQKAAFIKERASKKALKEQIKEMQAKLSQAQVDETAKAEADRLRAEYEQSQARIKALEDDLGRLDLTRSPEFRKQYDDRLNQLGGKMVEVLSQEGVAADEANKFVREVMAERRPSARERLIDDMAPGLKGTLLTYATQLDEVVDSRAAAIEKWKETASALEEVQTRQRVSELTGKVDEVAAAAVSEAKNLGNPYFMEIEGNSDWNLQVANRINQVKGLLLTGDFAKLAPLVAEGITAADLRSRYATLNQKLKAAEAELQDVLKGSPRLGGQPQAPGAPREPLKFGAAPLEESIYQDLLPPQRR
jgi:hypothetical protein